MSENPNPTVCGTCGATNPPGADVCVQCHAPLTLTAGQDALVNTPESANELRELEPDDSPRIPVESGGPLAPDPALQYDDGADGAPRD